MDSCTPIIKWFPVTGEMIDKFAADYGDDNPIHIDPDFAKKTYNVPDRFMHGALVGVLLGTYSRNAFGEGTMVKKAGEQNFSQFFFPRDAIGFSHENGRIRRLGKGIEYMSGTLITIWHRDRTTGEEKTVHQFEIGLCRPVACVEVAA